MKAFVMLAALSVSMALHAQEPPEIRYGRTGHVRNGNHDALNINT